MPVAGQAGTDDHIAVAIAVHIAGGGDRAAEQTGGRRFAQHDLWNCDETCRAAPEQIGFAGTGGAHDHVGVSVVVHIARRSHGGAEARSSRQGIGRGGGEPACGPEEKISSPGTIQGRTHDHIRISITVHIARAGHAAAEGGTGHVHPEGERRRGREPRRTTVMHVCRSFAWLAVIGTGRTDDHIAEAIAVHVARVPRAGAEQGPCRTSGALGGCQDAHAVRPAVIHGRAAGRAVERGAHDDIRVTVPVHITCGTERFAEGGTGLVQFEGERWNGIDTCGRSEIEPGGAFDALAVGIAGNTHQQVAEAVPVHIPGTADAPPHPCPGLVAFQDRCGHRVHPGR